MILLFYLKLLLWTAGTVLQILIITANPHPIRFDYNSFLFDENFATISWNEPDEGDFSGNYVLVKIIPGSGTNRSDIGNLTSIRIPRRELALSSLITYKIHIEATFKLNFSAKSDTSLQIPREVNSLKLIGIPGGDICIRPSSNQLTVIWPISDNKEDGSCACVLWFIISQCSCVRINNSFPVYNKEDPPGTAIICWKNIANNSVINVVSESINTDQNSSNIVPLINQEIFESYYVVIAELPIRPIVTEDDDQQYSLCFSDIFDGNSPIQKYLVTVTASTEFAFDFNQTKTHTKTCGYIPALNSSCGPFNISVRSQNSVGISESTLLSLNSVERRNVCKCFTDNVDTEIIFLNFSNPKVAVIRISCPTQYIGTDLINIDVELRQQHGNVIKRDSVQCSKEFQLQSLEYSTTYEINLQWISEEGIACNLNNTANVFTTGPNPSLSTSIIVGLMIVSITGIFVSIPIVFLTVKYCKK